MIRKGAFIFLLVILGCIGYLGFSIYDNLQQKQAIEKRIAGMPEFSLSNLAGETVQPGNETGQRPLILTYFHTECEFCRAEIRSINAHELLLKETTIYLVSDEPLSILEEFSQNFNLDSLQSIQVLHDSEKKIKEMFGVKGVPNTFVYDKEGNLLRNFQGETKADVLYELVK